MGLDLDLGGGVGGGWMGCSFVVLLFFDAGGAERCAIIIIVYHFLWLISIGFQGREGG